MKNRSVTVKEFLKYKKLLLCNLQGLYLAVREKHQIVSVGFSKFFIQNTEPLQIQERLIHYVFV
jgi:hypothetical protein